MSSSATATATASASSLAIVEIDLILSTLFPRLHSGTVSNFHEFGYSVSYMLLSETVLLSYFVLNGDGASEETILVYLLMMVLILMLLVLLLLLLLMVVVLLIAILIPGFDRHFDNSRTLFNGILCLFVQYYFVYTYICLLYTSPSPRD